jgi:hypothetical protein
VPHTTAMFPERVVQSCHARSKLQNRSEQMQSANIMAFNLGTRICWVLRCAEFGMKISKVLATMRPHCGLTLSAGSSSRTSSCLFLLAWGRSIS